MAYGEAVNVGEPQEESECSLVDLRKHLRYLESDLRKS